MPKFKNQHGVVIETNDVATANDYRTREGFTEVKSHTEKPASKSESK